MLASTAVRRWHRQSLRCRLGHQGQGATRAACHHAPPAAHTSQGHPQLLLPPVPICSQHRLARHCGATTRPQVDPPEPPPAAPPCTVHHQCTTSCTHMNHAPPWWPAAPPAGRRTGTTSCTRMNHEAPSPGVHHRPLHSVAAHCQRRGLPCQAMGGDGGGGDGGGRCWGNGMTIMLPHLQHRGAVKWGVHQLATVNMRVGACWRRGTCTWPCGLVLAGQGQAVAAPVSQQPHLFPGIEISEG